MSMSIVAVGAVCIRLRSPVVAEERHVQQAKHVKRCNKCSDQSDQPIDPADLVSPPENLVLAPKTGQRRDSGDRQRRNTHGEKRPRDKRLEPAHFAHILLAAHRVNHRARAQEQQALEERVCHQVEDARRKRARAAGHEHVAEL